MVITLDTPPVFTPAPVFTPNYLQRLVFQREHSLTVVRAHRHSGKTTALVVEALQKALSSPGSQTLIVSPRSFNGEEILKLARQLWDSWQPRLPLGVRSGALRFPNGSQIQTLSSGRLATGVRGTRPDLLLIDEPAFVEAAAWEALLPSLSGPGAVSTLMAGTPSNTVGGFFRKLCKSPFLRHRVDRIFLPVTKNPDYTPADLEEVRRRACCREEWRIEWLAMFPER